jgi:hypothetical protein
VIAISVADALRSVRAKAVAEHDLHNAPRQEYDVDSQVIGIRILLFVKRRERAARKKKLAARTDRIDLTPPHKAD